MTERLARAFFLVGQGRYELAEQELRSAVGSGEAGGMEQSLLALCLVRQERLKEAEEAARRGLELEPSIAFCHYVMADLRLEGNRPAESEASIRTAIELEPEDADYRAMLAKIRLTQARWSDALEAAEEGLKLDAEHSLCTDLKGIALTKLGRGGEASDQIDSALRLNPENSTAHANKGWLLLHSGRGREGIVHFREALKLDPNDEYARSGLVESLKSRSLIYGWILAALLWMTKFGQKRQFFIIIGAYVFYRILRGVARSNPEFAPFVLPLIILYNLLWLTFWFGRPFVNLLLKLDREGRLALSPDQSREATMFGWLAGGVVVSLALFFLGRVPWGLFTAIYFAGLLFPVMSFYDCSPGWTRKAVAAMAFGMAGLGLVGFVLLFAGSGKAFLAVGEIFLIGVLACVLVGPLLGFITPRR